MMRKSQTAIMIFVLLSFVLASFFIYPQADDFEYANKTLILGFTETQIAEYFNWNGRYIATAILTMSPLLWGKLIHYQLLPILLIISIFLSSVFFLNQTLKSRLIKSEIWFYGLAFTFLTITAFHTTAEGLYWLSSSYTYTIAIVFLNSGLGFLWSEERSRYSYFLACFFGLLAIGSNETSMVIWIYFLCLTAAWYLIQKKKLPQSYILVLLISFIAAVVVIKAPGNSVRASLFPKSHNFLRTVSNAALYSFIDPFKFLTLPLIAFVILNFERLKQIFRDLLPERKTWAFIVIMSLIFITFAPSLWGMGRRPNPRTMNIIVHAYLIVLIPIAITHLKNLSFTRWYKWGLLLMVLSKSFGLLFLDFSSGKIQDYPGLWQTLMDSNGRFNIDDKKVPKSIHFHFIESPAMQFRVFTAEKPVFFK